MISDVLAEAIAKIERYQVDPVSAPLDAEPSVKAEIEDVKRAMWSLRARLEALPEATEDRKTYDAPASA